MNILFITLLDIRSADEHGIYSDLIRELAKAGHELHVVSPVERRHDIKTQLMEAGGDMGGRVRILKLRTGNIQKTNIIEKGVSTVLLEYQLQRGIRKYLPDVRFDLILYSTPPITLIRPIRYIKRRDGAATYLMLKDIFPQNAADLGMLSKKGIGAPLYRYFRRKEKKLYALSDRIGCMSRANVDYVLKHNPELDPGRVELCPNAAEFMDVSAGPEQRDELRRRSGLPLDKKVFVYGGNLGRPQGIPFIIECLRRAAAIEDAFFFIVGSGTEYGKLEKFIADERPRNVRLMQSLPKDEYDRMLAACDVGLIFLDHRFTIPNFPSRLLSYIQAGLPVLAATDTATDIGRAIVESGLGWWCESDDAKVFCETVSMICSSPAAPRPGSFAALKRLYSVENSAKTVCAGREAARHMTD